MKTPFLLPRLSLIRAATMALLGLFAFPAESPARPRISVRVGHSSHRHNGYYHSYPRSGFRLSFGSGYAGRGYYYGPPRSTYFYERPGVYFYRNYYSVPRTYYGSGYEGGGYYGRCSDVQRALYGLGYYRGPIDGICGVGTRGAIIRYRSRHGLSVTALIDRPLLATLGIW